MNKYENPYSTDYTVVSNSVMISNMYNNIMKLAKEINDLRQSPGLKMVSKTFTITTETYIDTRNNSPLDGFDNKTFESIHDSPLSVLKIKSEEGVVDATVNMMFNTNDIINFGSVYNGCITIEKDGIFEVQDTETGVGHLIDEYCHSAFDQNMTKTITVTIIYTDV